MWGTGAFGGSKYHDWSGYRPNRALRAVQRYKSLNLVGVMLESIADVTIGGTGLFLYWPRTLQTGTECARISCWIPRHVLLKK